MKSGIVIGVLFGLFCFFFGSLFFCAAVSDVCGVSYCLLFVLSIYVLMGVICPKVMFWDWFIVCAYVGGLA